MSFQQGTPTGDPATSQWTNNSSLKFIGYLSITADCQDNASKAKSVTIPARSLIWVDFDDLRVL